MRLGGIRGITFDFGNTLVRVTRASLRAVTERTAVEVAARIGLDDPSAFRTAWSEERDRQFREEVPALREVDLEQRVVRILARLRGMPPPEPTERWDDAAAAALATPDEVGAIIEAYSRAFVETMPPIAGAGETLAGLADRGFRLAILSNWPLAATIDRYVAGQGWDRHLVDVVVSQRVGVIKPHGRIFQVAAAALALPPSALLHVGDDWAADVEGARAAGWRVAYLRGQQVDTPLPTSDPGDEIVPDLELDRLTDLPARIANPTS